MSINHEQLLKQHIKAAVFKSYLTYVKRKYPAVDLNQICLEAGLPLETILDENNWVSLEFEARFMELLADRVREPDLIFNVGKFGVRREILGPVPYLLASKFFDLKTLYSTLPFFASLMNKVMSCEVLEEKPGYIKFRFAAIYDGLNQSEAQLLEKRMPEFIKNTAGYYMAVPGLKGYTEAMVKTSAVGDGQNATYLVEVNYPKTFSVSESLFKYSHYVLSFLIFFVMSLYQVDPILLIGVPLLIFLVVVSLKMFLRLKVLSNLSLQAQDSLKKLDSQYGLLYKSQVNLKRKYSETHANHLISSLLNTCHSDNEIFNGTCKVLAEEMGYDRAVVLLINSDATKLEYAFSFGIKKELEPLFKSFKLDVEIESSDHNKISNVYRLGKPILIRDVTEHMRTLSDRESQAVLRATGSRSFVAVPIRTLNRRFGILIVDSLSGDKILEKDDLNLMESVGDQLAIALERIVAKQELIESYESLSTLADSYSRFVPLETMSLLNYKSIYDVKLGDGRNKNLTILFSDIRRFTNLCETMSPTDILRFLNSYYGKLSPIIKKNNGTIDKFIGDCIMAIFTDPAEALNAAVEMQRGIIEYNIERRLDGRSFVEAGIGVCHGPVVIGPLGFDKRMEITVLSDTVNIASRLDTLCKEIHARVLVSGFDVEGLLKGSKNLLVRSKGPIQVKGKTTTVEVFEILDKDLTKVNLVGELSPFQQQYLQDVQASVDAKISEKKSA